MAASINRSRVVCPCRDPQGGLNRPPSCPPVASGTHRLRAGVAPSQQGCSLQHLIGNVLGCRVRTLHSTTWGGAPYWFVPLHRPPYPTSNVLSLFQFVVWSTIIAEVSRMRMYNVSGVALGSEECGGVLESSPPRRQMLVWSLVDVAVVDVGSYQQGGLWGLVTLATIACGLWCPLMERWWCGGLVFVTWLTAR